MAKRRNNGERKLRNEDITDLEMLHIVNDVRDRKLKVSFAADVAERLGMPVDPESGKAPRAIGVRLAWMKRYGYLERIDARSFGGFAKDPPGFVVTQLGELLMAGRLSAMMLRQLEQDSPGTHLLLMREVARRSYVNANFGVASAVRREWLHQAARRGR